MHTSFWTQRKVIQVFVCVCVCVRSSSIHCCCHYHCCCSRCSVSTHGNAASRHRPCQQSSKEDTIHTGESYKDPQLTKELTLFIYGEKQNCVYVLVLLASSITFICCSLFSFYSCFITVSYDFIMHIHVWMCIHI